MSDRLTKKDFQLLKDILYDYSNNGTAGIAFESAEDREMHKEQCEKVEKLMGKISRRLNKMNEKKVKTQF